MIAVLAGIILGSTPAKAAARTFRHHAHEGNSALDAGRHAVTKITLSDSGRVDASVLIENRVAFNGYCFQTNFFMRDAEGNVLMNRKVVQSCVDGKFVPFAGPSKRLLHFKFLLPEGVRENVKDIVVVHGPGGRDPGKLLKRTLKTGGAAVLEVAAIVDKARKTTAD